MPFTASCLSQIKAHGPNFYVGEHPILLEIAKDERIPGIEISSPDWAAYRGQELRDKLEVFVEYRNKLDALQTSSQ